MSNILNETTFEEHIANCLASSDLYNQRTSQDFDIETLCDRWKDRSLDMRLTR